MKSSGRTAGHFISAIILITILFAALDLQAETPVERMVRQADEPEVSFNVEAVRMASDEFKAYVSDYVKFGFNEEVSRQVRDQRPSGMILTIPTPRGNYDLKLVEVEVTSPDYRVESASGDVLIDKPLGVHYRGVVAGQEGSLAAVSFFDGWFTALASTPLEGNFTANRIEGDNEYVSYFDNDLLIESDWTCLTEDPEELPEFLQSPKLGDGLYMRGGDEPCLRIHYEMKYNLFLNKGSVENAAAWLEGLHSQVAIMYANESINCIASYIHIWDIPDPFASGFSSLEALANYNQYTLNGEINGDLIHLVSNESGLGVAYLNTLCNPFGLNSGYSGINPTYNNFPTYSWSLSTVVHEIGHNLGSPHTHACAWNGNNTKIDDCGPSEGNCGFATIPPEGGTIMSYCHNTAVGTNLSLGFGPQPGDLIRLSINDNAFCLPPCPNESCNPPYQTSVADITTSEALVRWYHPTETNFEVRYGYEGNWNTVEVSDVDSLLLTGLESATKYEVYIRTICDDFDSDESREAFSTDCDMVFGLPYIELFEGATWELRSYDLDPCWDYSLSGSYYGWLINDLETQTDNTGPEGDHTSGLGKYVFAESTEGNQFEQAAMMSPEIDLGSAIGPFVSFWYHMFGADINRLNVKVSNDNGENWNTEQVFLGEQQSSVSDPWQRAIISLEDYEGEIIRIRFEARRGNGAAGDIAIDDILVTDSSLVDISVSSIGNPISGCGLGFSEIVATSILNSGFQTITAGMEIDLTLKLNEDIIANESIQLDSDLEPGGTVDHIFATTLDLSEQGEYVVSVISGVGADQIVGNDSRSANVVNKPIITVYPYTESFEDGSDWTSGGVASSWALGTPAKTVITGASDGDNAWVTGGLGLEPYNTFEESYVEGPCFDFSNLQDPWIEMDVWWEIETIWEGATFQSSIDGGQSWQVIGARGPNWFNSDTITTLPGIDGWTGATDGDQSFFGSGGWVTVTHDLTGLGEEPSVFLRMFLKTDPAVEEDGIAFDNITINGTPIIEACHEVSLNATTCDPGQAGEDVVVLQDENGCDSVVTTMTTLLQGFDILIQEYSCDPDDVDEVVTTYTAQNGCDSVVTERTDLWPSYNLSITEETCNPDEVGIIVVDGFTVNGCDSTVEINIVLADPHSVIVEESSCNLNDTGTVEVTLLASDGCDSVVTTVTAFTPVEADFTYVENEGVVTFTNTSSSATTYEWTFGDGNSNDTENPTNTYTSSGDYEVVLVASTPGCESSTETITITISIISGIDLISFIESINIFPNPSDGNFAVEIRGERVFEDLTFTLFNIAGGSLETREVPFNSYAKEIYNLDNLSNGIYFLRIQSETEQTTLKVNVLK